MDENKKASNKNINKAARQSLPHGYKKIRAQLFLPITAIVCVGVLLITLANSQFLNAVYLFNAQRSIKSVCVEIEGMLNSTSQTFYSDMYGIENNNNIEVEIYNSSNVLVYSSAISSLFNDWLSSSSDIIGGYRRKNMVTIRHKDNRDGSYFEMQQELGRDVQYLVYGKAIANGGFIKIMSKTNYLDSHANSAIVFVTLTAFVAFVLISIVVYIFVRRFTRPLIEMNEITRNMSHFDFSHRCPPYAVNEIGELGQSINTLSANLDSAMRDLQEKNKRLEEDIEHERRLEQTRKEFISNASHELKTPIAIIQGYAEGIKLGINKSSYDPQEYCDIIIEETHRMNRLVWELLELSKYESGSYSLAPERFEISQFVSNILYSYGILADDLGIKVTNSVDSGVFGLGDPGKLEMVFGNFVSNAIHHADGEKRIDISGEKLGDKYRVSVFNTGELIAEDDINNIWISFYRSDKSHSRSEGRFGLGLSIAKAIQEMHSQDYGVSNGEDGVTFWFDIALAPEKDEADSDEKQADD